MKCLWCIALAVIVAGVRADTIKLTSGTVVQGVVVDDSADGVTLRTKSGTIFYPKSVVASVKKGVDAHADTNSLPPWEDVLSAASATDWGKKIGQIPATVIDTGDFKDVPYYSYRAGDYEVNIYGDPDRPAGIEIGIYHDLLKSDAAKRNCQSFMLTIFGGDWRETIRSAGFEKSTKEINGWRVEVTPATDPDAYGGWWISIYSPGSLETARATEAEMKELSVKREAIADQKAAEKKQKAEAAADKMVISESEATASANQSDGWQPSDLAYSRPSSVSSGGSSGGSVFVHGYTRQNGTYVQSYTRAAPGMGHSGGHR